MPVVLVVDDDALARVVLRTTLATRGYRTLEAENGRVGVETARANDLDLVVMDLSMPVMNGFDAARLLRGDADFDGLPILAVSGKELSSEEREQIDQLFNGFFPKPLRTKSFLDQVKRLVRANDTRA